MKCPRCGGGLFIEHETDGTNAVCCISGHRFEPALELLNHVNERAFVRKYELVRESVTHAQTSNPNRGLRITRNMTLDYRGRTFLESGGNRMGPRLIGSIKHEKFKDGKRIEALT